MIIAINVVLVTCFLYITTVNKNVRKQNYIDI